MASVNSGTEISLATIADPPLIIQARLLSIDGRCAELDIDGEPSLSHGALVQFQTPDTLYLGEIQPPRNGAGGNQIRVHIEHSVNLERARAIRRLWNTDSE